MTKAAHNWRDDAKFDTKTLFGFFITSVTDERGDPLKVDATGMVVTGECGRKWKLYHDQDCCESVSIVDIVGDISDLEGAMIYHAEEVSDKDIIKPAPSEGSYPESETWTYYKLRTSKGWVEFRWHGSSNGYYSESVDFAVQEQIIFDGITLPDNHRQYRWIPK